MNTIALRPLLVMGLSALALATASVHAQQQADYSKVSIKTTKLADNFYTLEGQGGTVSVLTGTDGVLLVDSQFAPLSDKLLTAIKAVSDKPIRYLVNTHVHGDHTGGNENFAKQGVTLLGREQVRQRLAHPNPAANGTPGKPAPAHALPSITYDGLVTVHIDDEHVRLISLHNAHTDGDTLVKFVSRDILATGDVYRSVGFPIADLNNGGSLKGLIAALDTIIEHSGPQTRIIPGHGPVVDRAAVVAHRNLLLAVRDKVAALVAQGKTEQDVQAAQPTAEFDAQVPEGAQNKERFIKWLYAELKAGKA